MMLSASLMVSLDKSIAITPAIYLNVKTAIKEKEKIFQSQKMMTALYVIKIHILV